jgi:hypothetical protein
MFVTSDGLVRATRVVLGIVAKMITLLVTCHAVVDSPATISIPAAAATASLDAGVAVVLPSSSRWTVVLLCRYAPPDSFDFALAAPFPPVTAAAAAPAPAPASAAAPAFAPAAAVPARAATTAFALAA